MNQPIQPVQPVVTRRLICIQYLLGLAVYCFFAFPYLRRAHGLDRLKTGRRHLYVCNHVSLLDTILLGALCWRSGCYPILVLGDKHVWHASWIKRLLSSRIGFLLDRRKLNPNRIDELQHFGRAGSEFHLIVFPEGTRGDGATVLPCQPGIHLIAQEAQLPIVPIFIKNMQAVSTKSGRFHLLGGLRQVEVYFGEPIPPEDYLAMPREEFLEFIRRSILAARTHGRGVLNSLPVESSVNSPG